MAQHDGIIDNAPGATVRADINSFNQAAFTLSSGSTAPTVTYAHQLWSDESTGILRQRNAANTAWIALYTEGNALFQASAGGNLTAGVTQAYHDLGQVSVGTIVPLFSDSNRQMITATGDFTISAPTTGEGSILLQINQDATGGRNITLTSFTALGAALSLNTAANAVTYLWMERAGTTTYAQTVTTV